MTDPVETAVDALAVYRLTKLIVDDEIFADIRERFLDRYPPESTKLGFLASCPWCVSIYMGVAVVTARTVAPRSWGLAARALSFSAVTGLVSIKV